MPRHILIKVTKIKHIEKILRAAREKPKITYKGILKRLSADFQQKFFRQERNRRMHLK